MVIWIRNTLYDNGIFKSTGFNLPIISVGNITVGGTGKTPHVEYLINLLEAEFQVATLSRGYKRKTRDFRMASTSSTAKEIGDEPMQIKKRFPGTSVAVDRHRVRGVDRLVKQDPPIEVIILDDAFQHRSIKAGLSILLVDFTRPLDHDRMLPAGWLREPAINSNRAHIILVTRTPENIKPIEMREYVNRFRLSLGQHLYFSTMRYGELVPVFPDSAQRDAEWFKEMGAAVLVVSGIANPLPLREYAHRISTRVSELTYPDHHRYSSRDMDRISSQFKKLGSEGKEVLVLTTEKDAMRLREFNPDQPLKDAFHAVRIYVHFLNEDNEEFDQHIKNYVNSNKRSSILYQGED